jgi:nucleotide-binding universal stress UspA family protein
MYKHILIPTDGSELAEHAVTTGLSLAKSVGATVSVIVVEEPFNYFGFPEARVRQMPEAVARHAEEIKKHATSVLNRAAQAAKQAGVSCNTIQTEHEQPYLAIIAAAKDKGCDLIVMSSHGRGGLSAVLLGSVTNKVLTHTKTPVLVCH